MGSLAGATWPGIALAFSTLGLLLWLFDRQADALNAFLLGEAEAKHMGVNVKDLNAAILCRRRWCLFSLTGVIGFIGLIIPHLGRMLTGPNHKMIHYLPYWALILLIALW